MAQAWTRVTYLHRDAGNWKTWGTVWIAGAWSAEREQALRSHCVSGELFYPSEVGWPELEPTSDGVGSYTSFHEIHHLEGRSSRDDEEPAVGSWDDVIDRFASARTTHGLRCR